MAFRGTEEQEVATKRAWDFKAGFSPGREGEASAQRKVSAARFVESSLWVFFLALILRQAELHSLPTITTTPHLPPELL